jgi:hypothetical protein
MTEYDGRSWDAGSQSKKSMRTQSVISRDGTGNYTSLPMMGGTVPEKSHPLYDFMIDNKFDEEDNDRSFDLAQMINKHRHVD